MLRLFSRRRYEVLALVTALLASALHLWVEAQPIVGFNSGLSGGAALNPVARGVILLESRAGDVQFRLRRPRKAHPDVLVVTVDEKGAQKYGLWPWPREVLAAALTKLVDAGAASIGLDVAFTDAAAGADAALKGVVERLDQHPALPEDLARWREELRARVRTSGDEALEAAFTHGGGRIVQGVIPYGEGDVKDFPDATVKEHLALLDPHVLRRVPGKVPGSFFELPVDSLATWTAYSAQTPLARFAQSGSRLGHFAMVPDYDGTIRRAAILARLQGAKGLLPGMSLLTVAVARGEQVEPAVAEGELVGVRLRAPDGKTQLVPMDEGEPYLVINYPGDATSYEQLSIADVVDGTFDPARVKGKVVLVGVTVVGSSGDQRVTPFKELEPGVFTHAAVASNILSGNFLRRTFASVVLECLAMLAVALLMGALIPRLKSFWAKAGVIAFALVAWLVVDQVALEADVVIATVMPVASILGSAFGVIFLGYLSVDREKLAMRSTFTRYLGEDVMEAALENPDRLNKGEKREMTVLFSDIRGFTTLSERMAPEQLADFINEYLSPMTKIVFDEKGTLDKYIGDAVMAFWNAPLDQPDHAVRACRAAVTMLVRLEELKADWRKRGFPELEIGIGVNTGQMVVGNMGSDVRVDYTVLGDAVNLGARLEGTNKEYDTHIIISEFTWSQAKDQIVSRRLGAVRVKGKSRPVSIYELRGLVPASHKDAEGVALFEQAVQAFTARKFTEARGLFERVLTVWADDYPSRRYLGDIEAYLAKPPPEDWDGVVSLLTK